MAARVDADSGVTIRVEHLDTESGFIYCWSAVPAKATSCVVVCSGVLGDFMANYARERALGRDLAANDLGVVRFHYVGEGNSDGDRADMTFSTLVDNTRSVLQHARTMGFSEFAFVGSRIGAAVAATVATDLPSAPLAMWEPVSDPQRYLTEGHRAKRMSQLARESAPAPTDWRAELAEHGVIDLLGYDIHQRFVESFQDVDLAALLEDHPRPVLIARFRAGTKGRDRLADDLMARGLDIERVFFDVTEPWWFDRETDPDSGDLIPATTRWIATQLARRATP